MQYISLLCHKVAVIHISLTKRLFPDIKFFRFAPSILSSPLFQHLSYDSMICFVFARSLQERVLREVQPVCPQQAALVLSVVVGVLHECSDNGLMTFCSNKFSGSDVSSILLWRELVLISSKCSFFFSLSRDFCGSERKYFSPYLPGPHSLYALNPSKWIVNSTANGFFFYS